MYHDFSFDNVYDICVGRKQLIKQDIRQNHDPWKESAINVVERSE